MSWNFPLLKREKFIFHEILMIIRGCVRYPFNIYPRIRYETFSPGISPQKFQNLDFTAPVHHMAHWVYCRNFRISHGISWNFIMNFIFIKCHKMLHIWLLFLSVKYAKIHLSVKIPRVFNTRQRCSTVVTCRGWQIVWWTPILHWFIWVT